jgi:exodeoxyribonuclease V alpha subunit
VVGLSSPPALAAASPAASGEPGVSVFVAFCAAGLWPGLGRSTADHLAAAGITGPADVTEARLAEVARVSKKRAERLAKSFADAAPAYDVAALLHPAGLPVRLAAPAVAVLGAGGAEALRQDPWRLLELTEVTPKLADTFAVRTLARPSKTDVRRGRALALHVLARAARDGHTAMPAETVSSALAGFDVGDPATAIRAALDDGRLTEFWADGVLGLTRYAAAEQAVAGGVDRLRAAAQPLASEEQAAAACVGLDEAQSAAVHAVAAEGVSLLTGGPGTGKSRTVASVVALAREQELEVALAAPTGRAAKRLEELTGEPACTLHRLLGAQGTTGVFARGEAWPLEADVVVVDETSMLDAELAAALVEACPDGCHLLLVGDPAQLPSIGAGRVLGDLIDAGTLPVTELTVLHRQAEGGAIARLAASMRGGELPAVDTPDNEVVVVPATGSAEAARRVVQLVTDSIPRALSIPPAEVQVVTPVHRGQAGTGALNAALKAALNPGSGTLAGFDAGDRVVAVANHVDDGFANGEVGTVLAVENGQLVVAFATGEVVVPAKLAGDLRHGWALTIHRAQGSEWPAVVAAFPPEAAGMLSRPLVYTAVTRAQRHLSVVHAAGTALARAVRTVGARPRRTRLRRLVAAPDPFRDNEDSATVEASPEAGRSG